MVFIAASVLLVLGFCVGQAAAEQARAEMRNAKGEVVGTVTLAQEADGVTVRAEVSNLPPGFHGFHVHAVGKCDPPGFTSAGGHLNPGGAKHPAHAADLPVLLVNADGRATLTAKTDRFKVQDLFGADGSAFIIHVDPDNYANIPKRYVAQPDDTTFATGDAGGRLACGVISRP